MPDPRQRFVTGQPLAFLPRADWKQTSTSHHPVTKPVPPHQSRCSSQGICMLMLHNPPSLRATSIPSALLRSRGTTSHRHWEPQWVGKPGDAADTPHKTFCWSRPAPLHPNSKSTASTTPNAGPVPAQRPLGNSGAFCVILQRSKRTWGLGVLLTRCLDCLAASPAKPTLVF